jgi:hypothetical protein
MKLSKLKINDYFLSDSNLLFKVIPFTKSDIRLKKNIDRIKVLRMDIKKEYYFTNVIVRKWNTENLTDVQK